MVTAVEGCCYNSYPLFINGHYDFYDLIEEEKFPILALRKTKL